MKIAITGSTGIIGRELFPQLYNTYENAEFVLIKRNDDNKNIIPRVRNAKFDLLSITADSARAFFEDEKIDYFFHLAWDTNHANYLMSEENILWEQSTINLINSFYNSGGQKFIGIGSSIEYDWKFPNPFNELNSKLNGNNWAYGKSKLNIFNYLTKIPNISFQWHRIFFVFGPGQSNKRLIPLIINNALNNSEPLSVNLNLGRDYISTFEIAKQISMMSTTSFSGAVNVCSGKPTLISDIISKIEKITQKNIIISSNEFKDNFESQNISGHQSIIKLYFPDYNYSEINFENDLKKTIKSFY